MDLDGISAHTHLHFSVFVDWKGNVDLEVHTERLGIHHRGGCPTPLPKAPSQGLRSLLLLLLLKPFSHLVLLRREIGQDRHGVEWGTT